MKDPEFAARPEDGDVARFPPVEIVEPVRPRQEYWGEPAVIEIKLVGGSRLKIIGAYDPDALAALIRKLNV